MSYIITRRERGFTLYYPGDGDLVLEEHFLPGEGTVLFTRDAVTLMKGQKIFLNTVLPYNIENSDTSEPFIDMEALRAFFADTILLRGNFHSEIVQGAAGISWTPFDNVPCTELLVQNNSSADIRWCKGDTNCYLLLPAGESRTVSGITNANQVQLMLAVTEGSPPPVEIFAEAVIR